MAAEEIDASITRHFSQLQHSLVLLIAGRKESVTRYVQVRRSLLSCARQPECSAGTCITCQVATYCMCGNLNSSSGALQLLHG